jgi:adenylate cyclase
MQVQPKAAETPRRGIFRQLMLVLLACAWIPLLGLGLTAIFVNQQALSLETEARYIALVADAKLAILRQLDDVTDNLRGVGQLLLWPALNDEQRMTLSSSRITAAEDFDFVAIYTLDGHKKGVLGALGANIPEMPAELDAQMTPSANGERRVGQVVGQELSTAVVLAYRYEEEHSGMILVTHAKLAKLAPDFAELSARLGGTENVLVADNNRNIIIRGGRFPEPTKVPPNGSVFSSAESEFSTASFVVATDFTDANGTNMVGAIQSIPELRWQVAVVENAKRAKWALSWLRLALGIALGFAAVFSLLVAFFSARRLSQPIGTLVSAAQRIGRRDYQHVDAQVSSRHDELGELASSFDAMSDALKSSEETIKHETQVRSSLSRYVSSELVDRIVNDPQALALGGQRREVTVLFADVVGFTKLSEALPPETVVAILNEHFTVATQIIHRRGGMVDKFIGDCVMGVWGTIQPQADDADRALQAAQDMLRYLETQNRRFKAEHGVELSLGIGIHTGTAIAGNLGSQTRMEFTVIGDAVNVAARLEAMAQPGQILLSGETQNKLSSELRDDAVSVGSHQLRGRRQETMVYALTL